MLAYLFPSLLWFYPQKGLRIPHLSCLCSFSVGSTVERHGELPCESLNLTFLSCSLPAAVRGLLININLDLVC